MSGNRSFFPAATLMIIGGAMLGGSAAAQENGEAIAEGEELYGQLCAQCHALEEGEQRMGPTLHGIFGREAGALEDFTYSEAMQESDLVWDHNTLNPFIADPEGLIPGNAMPFTGVVDPDERSAILAFLADAVGPDATEGQSAPDEPQGALQPDETSRDGGMGTGAADEAEGESGPAEEVDTDVQGGEAQDGNGGAGDASGNGNNAGGGGGATGDNTRTEGLRTPQDGVSSP